MNAKQWAAHYMDLSISGQYEAFDALWAEDGTLSADRPVEGPYASDRSDLPEGSKEDRRFVGRRILYRPCGQWYVVI